MRVLWSIQYRGSDPANCRRKVERVLKIKALEEEIHPWVDKTHYIQFFSELEASSWNAAVVEVLNTVSRFSTRWSLNTYPGSLQATTEERKIEHLESLSFELVEDQKYRTTSALTRRSTRRTNAARRLTLR